MNGRILAAFATFGFLAVLFSAMFSVSCKAPEPNPSNIRIGMTREKVIGKFGNPDQLNQRKVIPPKKMPDVVLSDGEVIDGMEIDGYVIPEKFLYYSEDGSLVTYVLFNEEGRVTYVSRRKRTG